METEDQLAKIRGRLDGIETVLGLLVHNHPNREALVEALNAIEDSLDLSERTDPRTNKLGAASRNSVFGHMRLQATSKE